MYLIFLIVIKHEQFSPSCGLWQEFMPTQQLKRVHATLPLQLIEPEGRDQLPGDGRIPTSLVHVMFLPK